MLILLFIHLLLCEIFTFFVSLYKELLELLLAPTWETLSCCIVFNNLCKAFGGSVIADFISTAFGFQKFLVLELLILNVLLVLGFFGFY